MMREEDLLLALHKAQLAHIEGASSRAVFEELLAGLLHLTKSEYGFIGEVLYDGDRPYLKTYAITNIAWNEETRTFYEQNVARGMEFRNLDTLFGSVMRDEQPVIANSPATDSRRGGIPHGHPPLNAFLGLPFFARGRMVGMVGIANREGGYSEEIITFLTPFLSTCATLVAAVRVEREHALLATDRERFLDRAVVPMCILDFESSFLWHNAAWTRILGLSSSELHQTSVLALTHPDDQKDSQDALTRLAKGDIVSAFRSRLVGANGEVRWLEWSASPDLGTQKIFATAVDITERIRAEHALEDSASRMATVLDTVVDGIITASERGIIQSFNAAAEKIFGYSASEVIGENLTILMVEPHKSAHDGYLDNYRQTRIRKVVGIGREVEGRRRDGSLFPMDLAVGEMFIHGERVYTGIVRDITERHAIRKMKDEFVSTVSHELRTPLTSISGALRLLSSGVPVPLPAPSLELVKIANNNCDRLVRLIGDMLDIEKIHAGKFELRLNYLPVADLLEEAIGGLFALATANQIQLVFSAEDSLAVVGDRDRLLQVLTNLVSNAIKFSPASGEVQVVAHRVPEGMIRFEVKDRGPGIAPDNLGRLFQKFQQLDSSDTRAQGGTGLGLAISKSLVELHGGQVGVESVQGVGSTFWFTVHSSQGAAPPPKDARHHE